MELVAPIGRDQEDRDVPELAREIGDQLERRLVAPVEILDDDDDGAIPCGLDEPLGEGRVHAVALDFCDRERTRPALVQLPGKCQVATRERINERSKWPARLDLSAFAGDVPRPTYADLFLEPTHERALPQAGFAGDKDRAAVPEHGLGQVAVERRCLAIASDDDRTEDLVARRRSGRDRHILRDRRAARRRSGRPVHGEHLRGGVEAFEGETRPFGHRERLAARQERAHDLGHQKLTSLRVLREARRDDDRRADELPFVRDRLAGMDADADPHWPVRVIARVGLCPAEDRRRAADRRPGVREHDIKGVAFGLDLAALVLGELGPDDPAIVGDERRRRGVAVTLNERRVFAQVGKEEGPGRQHLRSLADRGAAA